MSVMKNSGRAHFTRFGITGKGVRTFQNEMNSMAGWLQRYSYLLMSALVGFVLECRSACFSNARNSAFLISASMVHSVTFLPNFLLPWLVTRAEFRFVLVTGRLGTEHTSAKAAFVSRRLQDVRPTRFTGLGAPIIVTRRLLDISHSKLIYRGESMFIKWQVSARSAIGYTRHAVFEEC